MYQSWFAVRNCKKQFLTRYCLGNRVPLEALNGTKLILDNQENLLDSFFGILKVFQRYPIPQTSNWSDYCSGTIFCCFLQQTGSRSKGMHFRVALILPCLPNSNMILLTYSLPWVDNPILETNQYMAPQLFVQFGKVNLFLKK